MNTCFAYSPASQEGLPVISWYWSYGTPVRSDSICGIPS
ncbi:hypothetical Protein YC6258_00789 [Gynuella sunshinyii YC6258]|uniref:Uncharacterized protein n=1 Tax=Gynuella sunshinyii YC6258 TaxID=1445510 RepID=A0A0C5VRG1_9GAMM|nr:hypothetical Protein YC6258_00789 [Gynuella sunshinyii YC6258]